MATLNELIAQLNLSSDNILSDAGRLNTTANNMNQTLDGIGVQEISGIQELLPDQRQEVYRQEMLPPNTQQVQIDDSSYTVPQSFDRGVLRDNINQNNADQGIMSQIKNAVKSYVQSGGILGMGANFLQNFIPEMDPRTKALRQFYNVDDIGRVAPGQLMAGYNPVSGNDFLNKRFGLPAKKFGLQNAYQKRIDRINKTLAEKYLSKGRSLDETQLDERLRQLKNDKIQESMMLDRVNRNRAYDEPRDSYSGSYDASDDTSYSDPFDLGGGE